MSDINLDSIDRKLLRLVQAEFPLTQEPYTDLGLKLGVNGAEAIYRIHKLKAKGIIRQISPVLDARRLGYQNTLVAMKVAREQLARAEQLIREHPRVSHGYEREHDFNLWITLAVPQEVNINSELERLAAATGAEVIFALPAVKVFKLRAYFSVNGDEPAAVESEAETGLLPPPAELSRKDRLLINELQQDLPLIPMPFTPLAARLNMGVADLLAQCQSLLQRGIMRRFGAAINHRKAGYTANAMACWVAAPDIVDAAGRKLASRREVSHCYERETNALWPYNLFAIIHGRTRKDCEEIVSQVTGETGLTDYVVLFSTKEFKKVRVKYLV